MLIRVLRRKKLLVSISITIAVYYLLVIVLPNQKGQKASLQPLKYESPKRPMRVNKYADSEWILDGSICRGNEWFLNGVLFDGPQGSLSIYIHSPLADQFVSGDILRKGSWESPYLNLLHEYLLNDTSLDFVDLGANLGVYTLTIAKLGRQVIAVEPFKPNIKRLCRTLEDNRVDDKVTLITNPLSNNKTTVVMHEEFGNIGGTHARESEKNAMGRLETITLDDVYKLKPLKKVIMKIDVESYENKVLQGGKEFFKNVDVQLILMEWVQHKNSPDAPEIIRFLTRRNLYPHTVEKDPLPLELYYFAAWPVDVLWIKKSNGNPWMKYLPKDSNGKL